MGKHDPINPGPERAVRPAWAWTGEALVRAPVLAWAPDGTLLEDAGGLPVTDLPGLVLPGLINAHTHLELDAVGGPTGLGFLPWLRQLRAATPPKAHVCGRNVYAAIDAGCAAVGEITNTGRSDAVLRAARLRARVWVEFFGIDLDVPPADPRLTAHAPHSTHPAVIRAAAKRAREQGRTWSIHFDEDPQEAAFLRDGSGEWPAVMRASGRDLSAWAPPGLSPAKYLDAIGVLDNGALLVHAVCTGGDDMDLVAAAGATVCLCPRSNLHIGGRLPDVAGWVARGVPLAIGTDSLGSSANLDPVADAAVLWRSFPDIDPAVWLRALTGGGADALAFPELGRLAPGVAPGLVHVAIPETDRPIEALFQRSYPRRWLVGPQEYWA